MESQGRRSPHPEPMRCDHCRKSFGLILHRYFRMRFCSADCLKAYQHRLDELTMMKIHHIDLSLRSEADWPAESPCQSRVMASLAVVLRCNEVCCGQQVLSFRIRLRHDL